MFGNPWWDGGPFHILSAIASWVTGFVLFLIWLAVLLLFVRFLLIATRAAKVYLRSQGEHDGLLPRPAPAPAPTAPAAAPRTTTTAPPTAPTKPAATKPAPRPRTPKPPTVG